MAAEFLSLGDVFERLGNPAPEEEPCAYHAVLTGVEVEHDVLHLILHRLCARELRALGGTCRALRALAAQAQPPGLRLALYPHQRASLAWMLRQEASLPHRAGILADEPGLGKTITCSALLCATAGLWTQPEPCARAAAAARDEAAWAALTREYRHQAVCRALASLRSALPDEYALFAHGGRATAALLPGYAELVTAEPTDYASVASELAVKTYDTFASFEAALRAVTVNALTYWGSARARASPAAPRVHAAARALHDALPRALAKLRAPPAPPALLRSRCTLVVVPRPLLRHWREQLTWHVQRTRADGTGGGSGGAPLARGGDGGGEDERDEQGLEGEVIFDCFGDDGASAAAERLAAVAPSSRALIATAAALREMPDGGVERFRRASVLVTTAERLSTEERRHGCASELLRVRWLRLVVDEGHLIGAGAQTAAKAFLHRLAAERRWVLSGTPAREAASADGLRSLDALLAFLRHPLRSRFQRELARPFVRGAPGAADSLVRALRSCMVRHLKKYTALPTPIRRVVVLRCSTDERLAYNTIVAYVRANLVLTAMEGLERGAGWEASLLHPANGTSARRALDNVRETCNGGGEQVASLSAETMLETELLLRERYRASDAVVSRAQSFMRSAMRGDALRCEACGVVARLHLLFPHCGHVACAECVTPATRACPVCAAPLVELHYDKCERCDAPRCAHGCARVPHVENGIDAFAYLQPGFELGWLETRRERAAELLQRAVERAPTGATARAHERGAAPAAGGTRGSAGAAGAENAASSSMAGCAAAAAAAAPQAHSAAPAPTGAASGGAAHRVRSAARRAPQLLLPHSKAAYVIKQIEKLRAQADAAERTAAAAGRTSDAGGSRTPGPPYATPPRGRAPPGGGGGFGSGYNGPRCVVYADSRRSLNVLGHFLVLHFGEAAVAQFWGRYRGSELDKFRHRRVRTWRCNACPPRGSPAGAVGAASAWRDVEWPDQQCTGRHVRVRLELSPIVLLTAAGADAAAAAAALAAPSAPPVVRPACVKLVEEDVREHAIGVRWAVGQRVHVPLGVLAPALRQAAVAAGEAVGGWVRGVLEAFTRCNAPMPAGCALSERRVDCFVLLLARDGSHGLDLSMVTHLFLIDKIFDAQVEAQVVSRAFRMGAARAVTVEQLLMAGTVEELIHARTSRAPRAGDQTVAASSSCALDTPSAACKRPSALAEPSGQACKRPCVSGTCSPPCSVLSRDGEAPSSACAHGAAGEPSAGDAGHAPTAASNGRRRDDGRVQQLLRELAFLRAEDSEAGDGASEDCSPDADEFM